MREREFPLQLELHAIVVDVAFWRAQNVAVEIVLYHEDLLLLAAELNDFECFAVEHWNDPARFACKYQDLIPLRSIRLENTIKLFPFQQILTALVLNLHINPFQVDHVNPGISIVQSIPNTLERVDQIGNPNQLLAPHIRQCPHNDIPAIIACKNDIALINLCDACYNCLVAFHLVEQGHV
jgi:hypothetical protein